MSASCGEAAPKDGDRLSSLSTGQLRTLCAELPSGWVEESELRVCDNGRTLYLDQDGLEACGSATTSCSASAGQWRACMRALVDSTCQAAEHEPTACTELRYAPGCEWLQLPLRSVCTPLSTDDVAGFDGVYSITSHTRNDLGCDGEGAAQPTGGYLALASTLYPRAASGPLPALPASSMLVLQECASIEQCQQRMAELLGASVPDDALGGNSDGPFEIFTCAPDSAGSFPGSNIDFGLAEGCLPARKEKALRREPDGFIRLETQTSELPSPAKGEPCVVTLEPGTEPRCTAIEVLRAQRVAPL